MIMMNASHVSWTYTWNPSCQFKTIPPYLVCHQEWKQIEVIQCVMEASLVHHLLLHITVKTCLSEKSFFIAVKLLLCAKKLISLIKFDFNFCCSLIQNSCFFCCCFFFYWESFYMHLIMLKKKLIGIDFPDFKFEFCIVTACEGLNRPCQSGVCDNGKCCHPNCIGGCTGETDRDCKVCKNVVSMINNQAICQKQCLPGTYTVSPVKIG